MDRGCNGSICMTGRCCDPCDGPPDPEEYEPEDDEPLSEEEFRRLALRYVSCIEADLRGIGIMAGTDHPTAHDELANVREAVRRLGSWLTK